MNLFVLILCIVVALWYVYEARKQELVRKSGLTQAEEKDEADGRVW